MRFMMLVKHAEDLSGPPPKALMDAIDKLTEEANQARTMVVAGGLAPTAASTHIRVTRGELKSKDEAVEGAQKFMELHRVHWPGWEGETEIRQIFGPEDFQQQCKSFEK